MVLQATCELICPVRNCSPVHPALLSEGDKEQMFKQQSCLSHLTLSFVCQILLREQTVSASLSSSTTEGERGQLTCFSTKTHSISFLLFLFFFSLITLFSVAAGRSSSVSPSLTQQPSQLDSIPPFFLPCGKNLSACLHFYTQKTHTHLQL